MANDPLVPINGCWVRRPGTRDPLGIVTESRDRGETWQVRVDWGPRGTEWIDVSQLEPGFPMNCSVQDVPVSATRSPLGAGRVIGQRQLGLRHQLLVQWDDSGRSVWLPYENVRRIKDVKLRYTNAEVGKEDHAERFRLKLLAHALENWNFLTGSLDRLDVDPLPHQIQLVHRILSSGNYNWLIADDVGLGKTIEVGLLLAALTRKGQARRVLVVSPAGLTRQWQDEMQFKFDQKYEIYGVDFFINRPEHWKLHDHVIVSLDLAKREEHMTLFCSGPGWDVVVFDEGHKLTRYASGERAQRFRLAEALRPTADAFLLLSGTPHQGYADRFLALLELTRPDLKRQVQTLEVNPEIVGEMILRNRKSEVTDADGNFVFKGHTVRRVPIEPSRETRHFQDMLRDYLQRGYKAGESGGTAGRAIGFVMTTYRKLASSSIAAISRALELRRERLGGERHLEQGPLEESTGSVADLAEGGDEQDNLSETVSKSQSDEFFEFETDLLDRLLDEAAVVRANDEKLKIFLDGVVAPLASERQKLLIFTEYRATQTYLKAALEREYGGAGEVLQINGSMSLDEKLATISLFNEGENRFLVSTEAGGEGLNLHRRCHVMVNYDLPWNPARLVQRIGRLYRYGQTVPVVVINLHAQDSFDNAAIDLMLNRVSQIVHDMAPVGAEFNDRLYADILGDVLENVDFASLLQSATSMEIERTKEQIEGALDRAQRAKSMQDEIFAHALSYDAAGLRGTLGFTMQHVNAFLRGMLPYMGATIEGELYGGKVLEVRLPDDLRGVFVEFGQRTVIRITSDRRIAQQVKDVVLLDFEADFFRHLVGLAKSQAFDGLYAVFAARPLGAVAAFKLRWQNDQGEPLTEEFVSLIADRDGNIEQNPPSMADWLAGSLASAAAAPGLRRERSEHFDKLFAAANELLATESTRFKHPNGLVPLAAADSVEVLADTGN